MIKGVLSGLLTSTIIMLIMVLSPAILTVLGSGCSLLGRLIGIAIMGFPVMSYILMGTIASLWGIKVFIDSK